MIYFTYGLIALIVVVAIIIIARINGRINAELKVSNDNTEALKKDAEIDELNRRTPIPVLRDRMREKVRKL